MRADAAVCRARGAVSPLPRPRAGRLGFPANDIGDQEPGTEAEIAVFCSSIYGVDFPMFAKIAVAGPDKHPLYRALIEARPEAEFRAGSTLREHLPPTGRGEVHWNFEKFQIDWRGAVIGRFGPDTEPEDAGIVRAIEAVLSA